MRKLNIDIFGGIPYPNLLPLAKQAGFEGFATFHVYANDLNMLTAQVEQGKSLGLTCDCVHSVIPGEKDLWVEGSKEGDLFLAKLLQSVDFCAQLKVPTMVVHVSPAETGATFAAGIRRLEQLVEKAGKMGVQIAFENIDHVQYLVDTLSHFRGCSHVGYCYDSGHEAIWTPGEHFLPLVGDRLIYTHIHDNGMVDDDHFLPGDGRLDFDRICGELRDTGYQGSLMLELNYESYENKLPPAEFLKRSYEAAARLAEQIG